MRARKNCRQHDLLEEHGGSGGEEKVTEEEKKRLRERETVTFAVMFFCLSLCSSCRERVKRERTQAHSGLLSPERKFLPAPAESPLASSIRRIEYTEEEKERMSGGKKENCL